MGMTGAGKSTFISHFSKSAVVGDSLTSCKHHPGRLRLELLFVTHTDSVHHSPHTLPRHLHIHPTLINNKPIFLIDTPGFDDTNRSDAMVLSDVADWLNRSFQAGIKVSGIIYLHRITDNRVGGSAAKNLVIFKKILGPARYGCMVITTTHWDSVSAAIGERRERELKENTWF